MFEPLFSSLYSSLFSPLIKITFGPNLITNGNFEGGFSTGLAADWTNSGGATVTEEIGVSGSGQGVTDGDNGIIIQQSIEYIAGQKYELMVTGRLKSGSTSGFVRLLSAVIGTSANIIEFDSTSFTTKTFVFTSQLTGNSPVRIFGQTGSICIFDNMSIKRFL